MRLKTNKKMINNFIIRSQPNYRMTEIFYSHNLHFPQEAHNPDDDIPPELLKLFDELANDMHIDSDESKHNTTYKSINTATQTNSDLIICPLCNKDSIITTNDTKICSSCGIEVESIISSEAEWRNYGDSNKSDPTRCAGVNNPLLYESSFSTGITNTNYSNYFYKTINKLQSWQMMSAQERSLKTVFDRISQQASMKSIPSTIIQYAQVLFTNVIREQSKTSNKLCRGANRDGLIAACLFYSCSLHKVNRSKKEIAQIFEIDESDVTKGCKLFFKLMNKTVCLTSNVMTHTDFIDRFCSNLGLADNIKKMVHEIADKAWDLGIVQNNTPPTIAAGTIFFVSTIYSLNLSKKIISQQCQTSHVTITKTYNILINHLEDLL